MMIAKASMNFFVQSLVCLTENGVITQKLDIKQSSTEEITLRMRSYDDTKFYTDDSLELVRRNIIS